MPQVINVIIPDIGDFKDIPIIEILVTPGDSVEKETTLLTLKPDKAVLEIPAPYAGVVGQIKVMVGEKVSEGSLILTLETTAKLESMLDQSSTPAAVTSDTASLTANTDFPRGDIHAEVVILGAGPGGYTAAFRAADLGKKVILIERYPALGGVCLHVGCIPSKALLHIAKTITETKDVSRHGVVFSPPQISLHKLRTWKESVINKLTKGLTTLAKKRQVSTIHGTGKFVTANMIQVETTDGRKTISFDHCIIAAGSRVARIPGFPYEDPRIIDSTSALQLESVPKHMLVIGGGIIGLEMATVYGALGSKISIVELMDQLIPNADADLVKPLHRRLQRRYEAIYLQTKVSKIDVKKTGLQVTFEGDKAPTPQTYDRVLMAVGRRPNGCNIGAENAGIILDEHGFVSVNQQLRTNHPHILAIGDIIGEPMLAHKATYEGKLAAEIIAGHKLTFDARTIPSVAYTDPEIAWMGLTEKEATTQGIDFEKAIFPWAASGRAISIAREEGMTKLIWDKKTRRIMGAGIVGVNAGELIAETVLALEMGADMEDISLTIHPHPTLSETVLFAAEIAEEVITDLYIPKNS